MHSEMEGQVPGDNNASPTPGDLQGLESTLDGEIASPNSVWEDVFAFLSGESTEVSFRHTPPPPTAPVISSLMFETGHLISPAAHLFLESREHTECETL